MMKSRPSFESLEERLALTINYTIAPGTTLDIYPLSSIIPSSPAGMDRMEVNLASVPGVAHGQIFKVTNTEAYPWGSGPPNVFTVGAGNNRILSGQGFRYVNNGTGNGTSESIPVTFRDGTGFNTKSDTIVISINSNLNPPTITTQPNPFIQIPPNGQATMSVVASGTPAPTYQWYRGIAPDTSNPIPGATASSYTTPALSVVDQYRYFVRVTNSGGSVNSQNVTVQVANPTSVATSPVSTPYRRNPRTINLTATVTPALNFGNVTYSVLSFGTQATSPMLVNGSAGITAFTVPGGVNVGNYDLVAHYQAPAGTAESFDTKTLTVVRADTTTTVANRTVPFSNAAQTFPLVASVVSSGENVVEGTVTFTVFDGATQVGSPVTSATVANGTASVNYTIPGASHSGIYTVKAVYNPGPNYNTSTDAAHTLTVAPVVTSNPAVIPATATSLVINGIGFDTTPGNNVVTFTGAVTGTVTAATPTQLTVSNLVGLSAGPLTVLVTTRGAANGAAVQVATVSPVVTSSTIAIRPNAMSLVIAGVGFGTTNAGNAVTFTPGVTGFVSTSSRTQIIYAFTTALPAGVLSATVTSNGVSSGAPVQVATVDGTAPTASGGKLNLDAPRLGTVSVNFSEDLPPALLLSHFKVDGLGSPAVTLLPTSVAQDPVTHVATFSFATPFAERNYRGTLTASGLTDFAGNPLAASHAFDFYFFRGDANGDKSVTFADLVALAQNYNQNGGKKWAQGDFNGDGNVNFADLVLLAQRYNTSLAAAVPGAPADFDAAVAAAFAAAAQPAAAAPPTPAKPAPQTVAAPPAPVRRPIQPVAKAAKPAARPVIAPVTPPAFATTRIKPDERIDTLW